MKTRDGDGHGHEHGPRVRQRVAPEALRHHRDEADGGSDQDHRAHALKEIVAVGRCAAHERASGTGVHHGALEQAQRVDRPRSANDQHQRRTIPGGAAAQHIDPVRQDRPRHRQGEESDAVALGQHGRGAEQPEPQGVPRSQRPAVSPPDQGCGKRQRRHESIHHHLLGDRLCLGQGDVPESKREGRRAAEVAGRHPVEQEGGHGRDEGDEHADGTDGGGKDEHPRAGHRVEHRRPDGECHLGVVHVVVLGKGQWRRRQTLTEVIADEERGDEVRRFIGPRQLCRVRVRGDLQDERGGEEPEQREEDLRHACAPQRSGWSGVAGHRGCAEAGADEKDITVRPK